LFSTDLSGFALVAYSLRLGADWGIIAVVSLLSVRLSLPLCRHGLQWRTPRYATALILSIVLFFLVSVVWASTRIPLRWTPEDNALPVLLFVFWLAVAVGLFSCCQRRRDASGPGAAGAQQGEDSHSGNEPDVFSI
ncbi:unnamed protein product, partial [Symbiodinium pilosum]